ncbi:hypothetical protein TAMYLO_100027 [Tenacibaculum amylolyticum]
MIYDIIKNKKNSKRTIIFSNLCINVKNKITNSAAHIGKLPMIIKEKNIGSNLNNTSSMKTPFTCFLK